MNLYNILADGYHTPLTKTQIAGLFHGGLLGQNQPCKQVEEKEWRTIDELFPLLRYETPQRSLYQPTDVHGSPVRYPALAILISILVISVVSLAGYFALRGGMHGSRNPITAPTGFRVLVRTKVATNPRAPVAISSLPVANTIVNATPLTNPPQPDIYLQQARPTQVRLDEEKRVRERRPSSLKTAATQSKKSGRNKRRPEGL